MRDIEKNNACKLTEPVDGPTFWVGPEVDFLKMCGGNGRLKRAGQTGRSPNGQVTFFKNERITQTSEFPQPKDPQKTKQEGNGPKDERVTMIMASDIRSDLRIEVVCRVSFALH